MDTASTFRNFLPPRQSDSKKSSSFHLLVHGQIDSGTNMPAQRLYCRYALSYGSDWTNVGMASGLTQIAHSRNNKVIWNFPVEFVLRSTNAHGWPRICFAIYGHDYFGRDVVQGYGSVLIPTSSGRHAMYIEIFRPLSGNKCHAVLNWLRGVCPEYYETSYSASGEGRGITKTQSMGEVKIVINTAVQDLAKCGFTSTGTDNQKSR